MTDLEVMRKSMIGYSAFVKYAITLLILQGLFVCHAKIESWERSCVVGECQRANSAYRSCLAQPLDIRLNHPNYTDVQSDSVFKNRPNTIAAESCGTGRRRDGDEFIPLCCPDRKSEEGMMVAGMGANINEFPHQVRILIKNKRGHRETCGGTIYNKDYVLTAASCMVHDGAVVRPAAIDVVVGQNLEHERIPRNIYFVRDIKVHEGYRATVHSYGRDNDIALLRLRDPLDLPSSSSHVKALRIPEKDFRADGRNAIILGWGSKVPDGKPIGALLKDNAHVNTKEECIRKSMMALRNSPNPNTRLSIDSFSSFEDLDSFEVRPPTSLSSGRSRSRSRGRGGSLFDDDDFFNRPWGQRTGSSRTWGKNEPVNLGALQFGKLWEGGLPERGRTTSDPLPSFPSSLLCIGGDGNGYSRGDSGGPAICEGPDGSPVLCGISSFGRNEFKGEWPATYINVAHYFDWIHSNAGRQPSDSLMKEVIDGEPIDGPDEASFFIRIKNKKTNITCGGALISSKTVISSSSCVPLDVRPEDLEVTSGLFSVDSKGTTHDVDGVATRETYKSYRSRLQSRSKNLGGELKGDFPQLNLAILKLYKPARDVRAIPLVKARMERMVVYEYGWRNDVRDKFLNKWAYKEVPLESCKVRYGAVGIEVDEAHLCASETYSGGELCNKELGNPLVCVDRSGSRYLCGVTSMRDCSFSFPTVFTNVVQNLDWIQL